MHWMQSLAARFPQGSRPRVGVLLVGAALGVCLGSSAAGAEVYFVREDGSDACDGTRDEAGQSGACAFRTIERCLDAARCGDTCRVRAGEYFED